MAQNPNMSSSSDESPDPRPKKRARGPREWEPDRSAQQRQSGQELLAELIKLYARCRLTATDLCRLCSLAHASGIQGGAWEEYAYRGENAQRHLDSVFPHSGEFVEVSVPINPKNSQLRKVEKMPVRALWSSLEYEMSQNECLTEHLKLDGDTPSVVDLPVYSMHPAVVRAASEGSELPIPLSFYLDPVAFIQQASGRCESVLGLWIINELSNRRHLVGTLKGADQCKCGCRGHCSIWPLLENVRWQLEHLMKGLPVGPPETKVAAGGSWSETDFFF